jgi:3-methyladenine DNA glycosylase AlkD
VLNLRNRGNITKYVEIINKLKSLARPEVVKDMARFGICPKNTYGVSIPSLRKMVKEIGMDHELALKLWDSKIHEARILAILASLIDDPEMVTEEQMEKWAKDLDSWDVCDLCCGNLFDKTEYAYKKAVEWSSREEEFVKRAGFVLMATLAVHDKKARDENFLKFFPLMIREATDNRNYVKKGVNWALRQIGKRNLGLNKKAIKTAQKIKIIDSKAAKWIASDAIRELKSESVQKRLRKG